MTIAVTTADIYSALDAERAIGSIRRIGGGGYRVELNGHIDDFKTYEAAAAHADDQVAALEADSDPAVELKKLQARAVVLEAKLRDAGIDLEAVASPAVIVKG